MNCEKCDIVIPPDDEWVESDNGAMCMYCYAYDWRERNGVPHPTEEE